MIINRYIRGLYYTIVSIFQMELRKQCVNVNSGLENRDLTAVGIRCADHATRSIRKTWH
jgi:hypothetical protein